MKIQLSISLLVSDRIETLGRCLSSLKPLLRELNSELIIVYTGKSEETLALAKEYTSHIIPFTWCKDFSKARNVGLGAAKGEWFLYLDDDEWFEDTEEIIRFFKSGECEKYQSATYVQRNYLDWTGRIYADAYVGRMCRLLKETRFIYPIHENLRPFPSPCKEFEAYVHHYGYVRANNEKEQDSKTERNLTLLRERLNTEKPSAHLYAQLAQEYASIPEYDEAIRYCREGLKLARKEDRRDSLEMWLQLELPHLIFCTGDLKAALEEGEKILASPYLAEVGEVNLAAKLVGFCWNLKEYKKGLKYVQCYRRVLEYLWKHPEKAMAQNGITSSFSGAEKQAAEIYVKGLFFAAESRDFAVMSQILGWLPWEDTVQMSIQYGNLEEWKQKYSAQKTAILKSYYQLESDNTYVALQKAYYAEENGEVSEAEKFWERCAANCPEGYLEQLIEMAVRNGFTLKYLLKKVSLEDWKLCARALAERIEIPDMGDFFDKISPELSEYMFFAESLRQNLLEKQLVQGFLELGRFLELMEEYCNSVIRVAGMIYRDEILENQDSYLLPAQYKFAVRVMDIVKHIKNGDFGYSIPLLSEALHIYPQMSAAVSHMTNYLNEQMKAIHQPVSEEFAILGGQVKQVVSGLVDGGQWMEAYGVINQLITLLPDDTEVLRLKQEIVRNLG